MHILERKLGRYFRGLLAAAMASAGWGVDLGAAAERAEAEGTQEAELGQLDPLQIQAVGFEAEVGGDAGGRSVVDREAMARTREGSLQDLMRGIPGVQANSRQGEDVFLNIRGSGLQSVVFTKSRGIDVFLEGVPLTAADGTFDYTLIDPVGAESLEVRRGLAARQYGGQVLGGGLELRQFGELEQPGGRVGFGLGSFQSVNGYFSLVEQAGANQLLGFRYSHNGSGGFRQFQRGWSERISAILRTHLRDSLTNDVLLNVGRQHQEVAMPVTQAVVRSFPKLAGAITAVTRPYYDTEALRLADRLVYRSDALEAEAILYYHHRDVDFRRPSMPSAGFRYGPGWLDGRTDDFGLLGRAAYRGTLWRHENIFTGGVRLARSHGRESIYHNLATLRGPRFADGRLTANRGSAWVENDLELVRSLHLLASVQAHYATRRYQDRQRNAGVDQSGRRHYSALTPAAGLRWDLRPDTFLYASYSLDKEPPAFGDLVALPVAPPFPQSVAWQGLSAQRASTIELGMQGAWERLAWQIGAYHSRLKNEILKFDDGQMTGNQVGRNAGRTIHQGVELAARANLWSEAARGEPESNRVDLNLAYTWNRYRFDDDPRYGTKLLAGVPRQMFYTELAFRHQSGFYVGPNLRGVLGSYPADNANTVKVSGHLLIGLGAGWEGEAMAVRVSADNLFDKKHVANLLNGDNLQGADAEIFFPGLGRSFHVSLEWKW